MWSLSTEVAFYLVLPVLMWLALLPRRGGAVAATGSALLVLAMAATTVVWLLDLSVRLDGGGTMIRLWLPSYLTWFAVGIAPGSYRVASREDRGAADRPRHGRRARSWADPRACAGWPRPRSSSSPPPRSPDRPTSRRPRSAPR